MTQTSAEASPLNEADPNSINDLIAQINVIFNKRPNDLSDSDLATVVKYFRSERHRFVIESKSVPVKGARRKIPTSVAEALPGSIEISADDF